MTFGYYTLGKSYTLHIVPSQPLSVTTALCGRSPEEGPFGFWYPVREPAGRRVCAACERAAKSQGTEVGG